MNRARQIRNAIYRLQRQFGAPVIFRTVTDRTVDISSGAVSMATSDVMIRKAIVLERRTFPDIDYDLSFIAANKNFTYGGVFTRIEIVAIVLGRDLPVTLVPKLEDYLLKGDNRFNIKDIMILDERLGYLFKLERVANV